MFQTRSNSTFERIGINPAGINHSKVMETMVKEAKNEKYRELSRFGNIGSFFLLNNSRVL